MFGRFKSIGANSGIAQSVSKIGAMGRDLVHASMATAQQANEQRQRVMEVLRRERQIAKAAAEISASSRAVSEQTVAVSEAIDAGNVTIQATNRSMTEMVATVTAGAELMQQFVARMAEVNKIVGEISDIARQTNLLALNAAIEAAHAGSDGDGFSVIAQEIRALADRASTSTASIEEKITRMNESAQSAASAMQVGRTAAGTSIVENARVQASLQEIRASMHEVQRISAQVAESSEEQIAAGRIVTDSVTQVDEMAARSSLESDAAAEMSIRLVVDAEHVLNQIRGVGDMTPAERRRGRRATDRILEQVHQHEAEMLATIESLRERCNSAGAIRVSGRMPLREISVPGLYFGSIAATDATAWVDQVSAEHRCGATIFVADGEDLIRATTSVKLLDGTRAIGTKLNPRGLAIASLRQGQSYFGAVYVLGNPHVAAYEPIVSSDGEVIGALYVGRPLLWNKSSAAEQ